MITGPQIRAARALLNWSAGELARRAKLGSATVARIEVSDGIPSTKAATLFSIQQALERGGIVFLAAGEQRPGGPGVRIRAPLSRPT